LLIGLPLAVDALTGPVAIQQIRHIQVGSVVLPPQLLVVSNTSKVFD
jgi:hypothetical protein